MNINNAFPSKWIKSGDIPDNEDLVLTIERVELQTVGSGEDAEQKPVVYFKELDKGLVLNKTNADAISRLHTPETDNWPGKSIALFATEVDFAGKQTLAIRVRLKAPKNNNGGDSLSLAQALKAIGSAAGVDEAGAKAMLREALSAKGHSGYNPERDTATVREVITSIPI